MLIILFFLSFLISFLCILFSVMFITLLERKVLSLSQTRLGPNKVSIFGIFQPLLDGMKLFLKENFFFSFLNKWIFFFGPFFFISLMSLSWICFPMIFESFSFSFSLMFFIMCIGLGVYSTLISGLSSNSKFSNIGSIRSMSQTISYEISLTIILFNLFSLLNSFSIQTFYFSNSFILFILFFPLFLIWMLSMIAECNRAPFDFSEGESELVSGFNTEFGSSFFAFLFIGEYGMIIFFSLITCFFFLPLNNFFLIMSSFFFINYMILARSIYPRFRYDKLMFMTWFKFLPVVIFFMLLSFLWNKIL